MPTIYAVFEDPLDGNKRKTVDIDHAQDPRAVAAVVQKTMSDGLSAMGDYQGRPAEILYAPRTILAILAVEDSKLELVPKPPNQGGSG